MLSLVQTSTKRRNILIAVVIIVVLVASSIGTVVYLLTIDNVIVSGKVDTSALSQPFLTSLQIIEFTDIQTGVKTSFRFPFATHSDNSIGNYSVSLRNGHTYSISVSYYTGPTTGNMYPASDNIGTFTVHTLEGKTSVSKNFP